MRYDTIIVGAGAAGAPLAARLTEDAARSVLLLEAGPYYETAAAMPDDLLNGNNNSYTAHDWGYTSEYDGSGRRSRFPRGRVVGGSSAVNTAIALRGVPEDYDEWAALGNDAWSWDEVLPYFRKLETDLDFGDGFHGRDGPVPIRRYREEELVPVQAAFLRAARAAGFAEAPDHNHPHATGVGPHPMNKRGRLRMSVAICYLEPARSRPNLVVRGDAHVCRIVTRDARAVGVEIASGGRREVLEGDRVVLSAGAIGTPAILMRSGLGPADHLREHGIDVARDLPGVGTALDDHPMLGVTFLAREGVLDPDDPLVQVTHRYSSSLGEERNDMQLMPGSQLALGDGRLAFSIASVIERQRSRGRVTLTSADPLAPPRIENRYCTHPDDVQRLVEGVRLGHALGMLREFAHLNAGLLSPSPEIIDDDAALAAWVPRVAGSGFHPSCTAKMAPEADPMGVVDQRLRVRGFDNLYVADASVMPRCPRANIHLTSIMIGERMADWLRSEG